MIDRELSLADYAQTCAYFKELHETRFRLLALLPLASGTGLALIPANATAPLTLALGAFGLLVTLGITLYDQRNTLIYNQLVRRAQFLEIQLNLSPFPLVALSKGSRKKSVGGAFLDRPPRIPKSFPIIWHDLGLGLVYSACAGSWTWVAATGLRPDVAPRLAAGTTLAVLIALVALALRNDHKNGNFDTWKEDQSGAA